MSFGMNKLQAYLVQSCEKFRDLFCRITDLIKINNKIQKTTITNIFPLIEF